MEDDGSVMAQTITEGAAIAVSDSSLKGENGTAAWVLEGRNSLGHILGTAIVLGDPLMYLFIGVIWQESTLS
jgi:hypothetical protein